MIQADRELIEAVAARYLTSARNALSPAERTEVVRIALGFACKESAAEAGVSGETIRARRKRIYRKLDLAGSHDLVSSLLRLSLGLLAAGERLSAPNTAVAIPAGAREHGVAQPHDLS